MLGAGWGSGRAMSVEQRSKGSGREAPEEPVKVPVGERSVFKCLPGPECPKQSYNSTGQERPF